MSVSSINPSKCLNPSVSSVKMAGSRVLSRLSAYSSSLSLKLNVSKSSLPKISPVKSSSQSQMSQMSSSAKRFYQNSRLPVELSCLVSMVPLHSTTASARLRSLLPIESPNWGLVPQGKSMPL